MSKTYAIGDLHGRLDLLNMAIARIEESNHSGGTIVLTGDYIDRGPDSKGVVERLMAGPSDPERWTWICLQGNHDAFPADGLNSWITIQNTEGLKFSQRMDQEMVLRLWNQNGGSKTLLSYDPTLKEMNPTVMNVDHILWLMHLPYYHIDDHRLFVHAGVVDGLPMDQQSIHTMTWMLYDKNDDTGYGSRHVVHGHHQYEDGPVLLKNRTDIDTLAWYTGRLVVCVFDDDKPGGPVSTIEIKGPHYAQLV